MRFLTPLYIFWNMIWEQFWFRSKLTFCMESNDSLTKKLLDWLHLHKVSEFVHVLGKMNWIIFPITNFVIIQNLNFYFASQILK